MTKTSRRQISLSFDTARHLELMEKGILFLNEAIPSIGDNEPENFYARNIFCRDLTYLAAKGQKNILVVLSTPGGDVFQGLAIYDMIRMFIKSGLSIDVLCTGLVASAGTIILQAGERRYASPTAQFMVHRVKEVEFFSLKEDSEAEEQATELKRLNDVFMNIIAQRAEISLSELLDMTLKKDHWLGANDALRFGKNGLIDSVVTKFPATWLFS